MSGIVLSASIRQSLLSLQSTATLLATTQNNLATGKRVNSAVDNPTNFFTAQSLDNRASDISNLLSGIGNGAQVLQAANAGITSLQKIVDSAKSIANQALQSPTGYSAKASVTSAAITSNGQAATADDLRGSGTFTQATIAGTALNGINSSTHLSDIGISATDVVKIQGVDFSFSNTSGVTTGTTLDPSATTLGAFFTAVFNNTGGTPAVGSVSQGKITFAQAAGLSLADTSGTPLAKLGLTNPIQLGIFEAGNFVADPAAAVSGSTLLSSAAIGLTSLNTLTVNGKTISFANSGGNSISSSGATLDLTTATVQNVLTAIDTITGTDVPSSISGSTISLSGGYKSDLSISGTALGGLGLTAGSATRTARTLSFGSVGNGTPTTVTFRDGTGGTIKSLAQLNSALAADNLTAALSATGALTVTTTNDAASSTIGTIGGTAFSASTGAFYQRTASAPIADGGSQNIRYGLVAQYNNVLAQITSTARDASFNGANLLGGDTLKLTFNETGKSALSITGVNLDVAGLGLASLAAGTDFVDNASTNKVLTALNNASAQLRSQASAFGSNLSVIQIRQDFNQSLVGVLQAGSTNLTLTDTNQGAANSQALTTRQSIAVSAIALANQSQAGVLQLLR